MALKNLHQVEANIRAKLRGAGSVARERLYEAGEMLLTWSLEEAPKLTGELRESGHVTTKDEVMSTGVCKVFYTSPYALRHHEVEPDYQNRHTPGTKHKYLEDPLREHQKDIVNHVAGGVKKEVDG